MHLPTPNQLPAVQYDPFIMQGGVDQITPLLALKTGVLRDALNHEASILGGYARIGGYERSDGTSLPSSATWTSLFFSTLVIDPSVGDIVTGQTSGATGYVLAAAANYIIITEVVGQFQIGEVVKDATLTLGTTVTPTPGSISALLVAQYFSLAADRRRTHIGAVPGTGTVRGVFIYNDVVYAWRDNANGTSANAGMAGAINGINATYALQSNAGETISAAVISSLYKRDWQGNQLQYSVARTNQFRSSEDLTGATWSWVTAGVPVKSGVLDPRGTLTAGTLTAAAPADYVVNSLFGTPVGNKSTSIWLRRRTGTGQINVINADFSAWVPVTLTSSWQEFTSYVNSANTNMAAGVQIMTIGDSVDIAFSNSDFTTYIGGYIPTTVAPVTVTDYTQAGVNVTFASAPLVGSTLTWNGSWTSQFPVGTVTQLFSQTATGWKIINMLYEVAFTAGTTQPAEGSTLTQGGVTATIKRVATQSGVWAGSAAGRFIISAPVGGNFIAGAATVIGGTTVTLSGVQTAITFIPGGTFDHQIGNFGGQASTSRVYGCDGVNRGFEFDGTTLVPISTGSTPDQPSHVAIHKNYLFWGIMASMVFSAPGLPYDYTAIDGAGVIAVGNNITNMIELPGAQTTAAMGITTRTTMYVLYGTGASTWNLVPMNVGTGGIAFTAENMQHTYFMDDRGIIDMQETLNYGNFNVNTISYPVNNFIIQKRSKTVASSLQRTKSQYRIFFNDGSGLYITNVHGQYQWMNVTSYNMPVLFPNPVSTIWNAKLASGDEVTYFGSTNGFVYKLDSGTSFDGAAINAYLTFAADQVGSPRMLKRYRHAQIEISSNSYASLNFGYKLGFGSNQILQPAPSVQATSFTQTFWDAFVWDAFTWDGLSGTVSFEADMTGTAENYAFVISSNANYLSPYIISSAVVHYTQRRGKR